MCISDGLSSVPSGTIDFGNIPSGFIPVRIVYFETVQSNNDNAMLLVILRETGTLGGHNYGSAISSSPNILTRAFTYITAS